MSVEPGDYVLNADEEVREALITYCRLPSDAVERISETMRVAHLSFRDAALHLGLVTEREAAEAHAWICASQARKNPNIIEAALFRQGHSQSLTVRHSLMGNPGDCLLPVCDPGNPHSEELRALRTELLLLSEQGRRANCLAVLSPGPHEGRSQLAAELAITFSQLGRRTLLVDADLRHSAQHVLFGSDVQWGLAQSLAFGEPAHLIGVTGLPFLTVLPSGPRVPNPLELISGGRFEHLIRQSRFSYDFIIFDTPPASQYADALTVAALAGQTLLLSRAAATAYGDMKSLVQRLGPSQTRILGGVIKSF